MIREYVLGYILPKGGDGKPDRQTINAAAVALRGQIQVLDRAVEATGYLVGDYFTYADINLLPALDGIQNFPEGMDAMAGAKSLSRYFHMHSVRPSSRRQKLRWTSKLMLEDAACQVLRPALVLSGYSLLPVYLSKLRPIPVSERLLITQTENPL